MKIEIVKTTNGLNEHLFRAYAIDKDGVRISTVGIANTELGAEEQVRLYKLKSQITEESVKVYEI